MTSDRVLGIERVLAHRLKGVSVLLEGIYDHGNMAAVMRTCEALGVYRVHFVDLPLNPKAARRVGQGAQKWLSLRRHTAVPAAVSFLRQQGYRLWASSLGAPKRINELDLDRPVCLVFGNEHEGISAELRALCDESYEIPMLGYTQSLNVACAASIALFSVTERYRQQLAQSSDLSDEDRAELREEYHRRVVRGSELLIGARASGQSDLDE
jgi:tRNA (guanosine-2'-O-)-methyltransferase